MSLKDYLIFFRWKNVLMILLIQFLFKYVLFQKYDMQVSLDDLHFVLLALSTVFVAIAGYIINDIHDVKADIINKPQKLFVDKKLTRISAQNLFIGFNSAGLLLGMYLSYYIRHTSYFIIYVLTSLLLYQYAKYLKIRFLLGNLVVASIVFFCILMIAVFDVAPATNFYNLESQRRVLDILFLYGGFGFVLTFLREVVKDMEDIEGDRAIKARSLPIIMGQKKTTYILMVVSLMIMAATIFLALNLYEAHLPVSIYLSATVTLPLLLFMIKLARADKKSDFHKLSALLKIIMLLGMLSIIIL